MECILSPYFYTAIAGVLIVSLPFYYLRKKGRVPKSERPPEPAGKWPIIGHLPLLAGSQLFHREFGSIADNYGPIFVLQLGVNPTLVVSSWELAQELFTTHDLAVASRPQLTAAKYVGYNFASFALAPYGRYWREIRKIAASELLSNARIELLKHIMIQEIEMSIKELYKIWEDRRHLLEAHVIVDLKPWFSHISLNVIARMIAGKKYFGAGAGAVADETEKQRWEEGIRELVKYLGMFFVRDTLPFLGWLDIGGHEKAVKRTAKKLDRICQEWLEEHKQKRLLVGGNEEQDFIDVMLSVLDGKKLAGFDADTVNKATCLTLVGAGSDSSVVTLTWAASLLLNNQHILAKAKDELDRFVGKERLVNDKDICNLQYLQAIVKETLRLYPPGPLLVPHQFIEDRTVGGYHVPKGTWLLVNAWKIQTDSRVWPNPLEFRPERFLAGHKDVDAKGQHFEFIPFGCGRRACPGESFALRLINLTLATFIQAFEFSTPSNAPVDMTESPGIVIMKSTPLEVLISPRLSPLLYS